MGILASDIVYEKKQSIDSNQLGFNVHVQSKLL